MSLEDLPALHQQYCRCFEKYSLLTAVGQDPGKTAFLVCNFPKMITNKFFFSKARAMNFRTALKKTLENTDIQKIRLS